jgi:hypothetical protein
VEFELELQVLLLNPPLVELLVALALLLLKAADCHVVTVLLYCRDCTAGMPWLVLVLVKQEMVGLLGADTSSTCRSKMPLTHSDK